MSNLILLLKASKRQPGTSGRLHRTVTGEWVWSSEEESGDEGKGSSGDEGKGPLPLNRIERDSCSDDDGPDNDDYYHPNNIQINNAQPLQQEQLSQEIDKNVPINLVLRLRFNKQTI